MRRTTLLIIIAFLLVVTYACTGNTQTSSGPANALFFDNFTKTDSGWTRFQSDSGIADYTKGYYHILINKPSTLILANAGQSFTGDVSVEVDARKINGSDDNYFGVLCHYQDPDNYYMFLITSDGYSGIAMRKNGQDVLISPGLKFLKMDGIKKGSVTNHIRADCIGEALTLYANEKQVSQAYDNSLTGGDVGLAARSGKLEGGVEIRFNNFTVSKPVQP